MKSGQELSGAGVPQPYCPVIGAASQRRAVARERHTPDRARIALQRGHQPTRARLCLRTVLRLSRYGRLAETRFDGPLSFAEMRIRGNFADAPGGRSCSASIAVELAAYRSPLLAGVFPQMMSAPQNWQCRHSWAE